MNTVAEPRNATLDLMIDFAMQALLSDDGGRRRAMVRRMAERWPREPALALAFAVTSATQAIEDAEARRDGSREGRPDGSPDGSPDGPPDESSGALPDGARGLGLAAVRGSAVPLGYRLSALIAADVHAVQSMGQAPSAAGDLLHFWRRVDPLFLRLR
jgi:hypothetical protein